MAGFKCWDFLLLRNHIMTSFCRCFHSQTMNIFSIFKSTGVLMDVATIFSKGGGGDIGRGARELTYRLPFKTIFTNLLDCSG
jgi:hypothetical protein